ncbi:MAG: hypothetical protein L6R37_008177 [Teloschistes peruensis]|nr:MAG: hypothetical protein L6R37_008177 [Teloschistes peruensis]
MATRYQRGWTVPGIGLPLRWPEVSISEPTPREAADARPVLISALDGSECPQYGYAVRELTMIALINELTDMPDWDQKVFDPDFAFAWKSAKVMGGRDITRSMVDWCIEEVMYYVRDFIASRIIPAIDGGVSKSDDCVPTYTKHDLQQAANLVRKGAIQSTRWHIHTHDIVDPYMFPFIFERTRITGRGAFPMQDCIALCGQGWSARKPPEGDNEQKDRFLYPNDMTWSRCFQWLPFDVSFSARGEGPSRIMSYINNIHPMRHHAFYRLVESLVDVLIPFFNRTLLDLKAPGWQKQRLVLVEMGREPMLLRDPEPFRPPEQRMHNMMLNQQGYYLNDKGQFQDALFVDLKKEFWNIGVQFVLQMQDIDLKPHDSDFPGEEWHVQGQTNERICATAYYVYSTDNLSDELNPTISFRARVNPGEADLANGAMTQPPYAPEVYGAEDGSPAVQNFGEITLREDRAVVFPNTFQVKINAFSTADTSRSGHLRILMLHLLDPNRRNMSTGMVPCQRRDWWADEMRQRTPSLWRLPREIFDKIIELVDDYPISYKEAERTAQEFRHERKEYQQRQTEAMMDCMEWDFGHYHE